MALLHGFQAQTLPRNRLALVSCRMDHAASATAQVQRCTLLSIKTGGCPENCSYCSQSSAWRQDTGLKAEKLLDLEEVYQAALRAKASGSTRFCMGAAWRGPSQVRESWRSHQRHVVDELTCEVESTNSNIY